MIKIVIIILSKIAIMQCVTYMGYRSNATTYFWENLVSGNLFEIGDHVGIASIIITQNKILNTITILYLS